MDLSAFFLARAPKFNGESGDVWDKWICRFEAQTSNMEAGDRLAVMVGLLEGVALDTFVTLSPESRKEYGHVRKALETRFGKQVSTLQAHAELNKAQQTPSESVESFADRIKELSSLAHPDLTDGHSALEGFQCGRFICGLRDARLQEKLCSRDVRTLTEPIRLTK